jgi:hypothetical protein
MNALPLVLDCHDGEYAYGSIGLVTANMGGALFDKIRLEPVDC